MTQTKPPATPAPPVRFGGGGGDDPEDVRKILRAFIVVLALAAVALLVLLFVLLRSDEGTVAVAGRVEGYPIQVVQAVYGAGAGDPLSSPLSAAFDPSGNLWIADTGNGRVVVTTVGGRVLRVLAEERGPGALSTPYGITADAPRDRMYVADWTKGAVVAYSTAGRFLEMFPAADQDPDVFGPDGFTPYDVAVAGSSLYVASNDGVYEFDRRGRVVARFGTGARGRADGAFNFPDALEVDAEEERIYVADTLNRRVVALDFDGRVQWVSGKPDDAGAITGFWQLPRGIALGPEGTILVVDTFRHTSGGVGNGHFVALAPDGRLVSEFGRSGDEEDSFRFPEHLAAGSDGLYAVADREHDRVLVFRLGDLPPPDEMERDEYRGNLARPEGVEVREAPRAGRP